MDQEIRITAQPSDGPRCKFLVDRPVDPGRWAYFSGPEVAGGSPLAERLFAIEGVASVLISHDQVVVTRSEPGGWPVLGAALRGLRRTIGGPRAGAGSWPAIGRQVGAAIRAHLASGRTAVAEEHRAAMPTEVEIRARVERALAEEVNPVVAGHGGSVRLVDVKDNVVYLRMAGGCQGCGLADVTLKQGVEAVLRAAIPELGDIIDLTDHSAGLRPYVRASKGPSPPGQGGPGRRPASPFE